MSNSPQAKQQALTAMPRVSAEVVPGTFRHNVVDPLTGTDNVGLELGVATGVFSERMVRSGKFARFFGVDAYSDKHDTAEYKLALERIGLESSYILLRMRFDEALDLFDDNYFDFIYVDGYAGSGLDGGKTLIDWFSKLKIGGVMAGDDYSTKWPLVMWAVNDLALKVGASLRVTEKVENRRHCYYPSWFFIKERDVALSTCMELTALAKQETERLAALDNSRDRGGDSSGVHIRDPRLSRSQESIRSKYIDADPGNGFGAKYLTRSLLPPAPDGREGSVKECLDGVQILTRYCSRERPYWSAFVDHYVHAGVKFIHACVQGQDDRRDLLESPFPSSAELVVHLLPGDLDNSAALRCLNVTSVVGCAPYTMMVDCDEYFHALNPGVSIQDLFAIFPDAGQLYIPWVMCPVLGDDNSERAGFWGQTGKPVARSERIASIAQEHGFRIDSLRADPRDSSVPVGTFGCVLIHYWSRGFRDCLLKTFNNRIREWKSSDLDFALDKIRSGDLPIRLRLLAYLHCQARYLTLPDPPFASFDRSTEEAILRRHLSEKDEDFCRNVFEDYLCKLRKRIRAYPIYPAVSIQRVARLLPFPQELDRFDELGERPR